MRAHRSAREFAVKSPFDRSLKNRKSPQKQSCKWTSNVASGFASGTIRLAHPKSSANYVKVQTDRRETLFANNYQVFRCYPFEMHRSYCPRLRHYQGVSRISQPIIIPAHLKRVEHSEEVLEHKSSPGGDAQESEYPGQPQQRQQEDARLQGVSVESSTNNGTHC